LHRLDGAVPVPERRPAGETGMEFDAVKRARDRIGKKERGPAKCR
jgi:hypothetical protein